MSVVPTSKLPAGPELFVIGLIAVGLVIGAFQIGRQSVASTPQNRAPIRFQETTSPVPSEKAKPLKDYGTVTIRNIATVPFSELYDILRTASRTQISAWGQELEGMPDGPQRTIAVIAFYKSLVQVDARLAMDLILHARNILLSQVALESVLKAAPESSWGDLTEMFDRLPWRRRGGYREDPIWLWSRVDPVAVSKYIEKHPVSEKEDSRLMSLLGFWGEYDPVAARKWMEEDASRQTSDAIRFFLSGWEDSNRNGAVEYAIANAGRSNFAEAVAELAYKILRTSPEDARAMILRLPIEQANAAMDNARHMTVAVIVGENVPEDHQKPPDYVAPWMVTLPPELWQDKIGDVVALWLRNDNQAAAIWLNSLRADTRDLALADLCGGHIADQGYDVSPERVIELGLTITDAKLRQQALTKFVANLGQTREEMVEKLGNLQLSHEQNNFLRRLVPKK